MKIILVLIAVAILFFLLCVVVSAIRYLYGEAIHNIKNFKRFVREALWDLEWKWNH